MKCHKIILLSSDWRKATTFDKELKARIKDMEPENESIEDVGLSFPVPLDHRGRVDFGRLASRPVFS